MKRVITIPTMKKKDKLRFELAQLLSPLIEDEILYYKVFNLIDDLILIEIEQALTQDREELIEKMEGMKGSIPNAVIIGGGGSYGVGHNQAISECIKLLKGIRKG